MANETLEVRVVGTDEIRRLDSSLAELSRTLDSARAESRQVNNALETTGKAFNALKDEANTTGSALGNVASKGFNPIKEATRATDQNLEGISRSFKGLVRNTNDFVKAANTIGPSAKGLDEFDEAAKDTDQQVLKLSKDVDKLGKEFDGIGRLTGNLGGGFGGLTGSLGGVSGGLTGLGAAGRDAAGGLGLAGAAGAAALEDILGNMTGGLAQIQGANAAVASSLGITAAQSAILLGGIAASAAAMVGTVMLGVASVNTFVSTTTRGARAIAPFTDAVGDLQIAFGESIVESAVFQSSMNGLIGLFDGLGGALSSGVRIFDNLADVFSVVVTPGKILYSTVLTPIFNVLGTMITVTEIVTEVMADLANTITDWVSSGVNDLLIDNWNDMADSIEGLISGTDNLIPRMERMGRTVEGLGTSLNPGVEAFNALNGVMTRIRAEVEQSNLAMQTYTGNWVRANAEIINITQSQTRARQMMISLDQALGGFFSQPDEEPSKPARALNDISDAADRANAKIKELATEFSDFLALTALKESGGKKDPMARFEGLKPGMAAAIYGRELDAMIQNQVQRRIKEEEGALYLPPNFPLENPYLNTEGPKITGQRGAPIPRSEGYDPKLDPKMARTIAEALSDAIKPGESAVVRTAREAMVSIAQSTQNALSVGGLIGRDQIEERAAIVNPLADRSGAAGRQSGPDYLTPQFQASYFRNTRGNNPRMDELARIEDNAREMLRTGEISIELFRSFVTSGIATVDGLEEYLQQNASPERLALFGTAKEAATYTREITDDFYGRGINSSLSEKDQGNERVQARDQLGSMSSEAFGLDISPWVRSSEAVREYTEALKQMSQVQKDSVKLGVEASSAFANSTKAGLGAAAASSESFADTFRAAMGSALISEGVGLAWKGAGQALLGNPIGVAQLALGGLMIGAGRTMGGTGAGPAPSSAGTTETVNQGQNTQISVLNNFGFVGDRRAATREISAAVSESRRRGLR